MAVIIRWSYYKNCTLARNMPSPPGVHMTEISILVKIVMSSAQHKHLVCRGRAKELTTTVEGQG